MPKGFKYELGEELKDIVTGFRGIVMARTEYFTGCMHYGLASKALTKDGKVGDWEYFDESRLVLVSEKKLFNRDGLKPTSGPGHNPPAIG